MTFIETPKAADVLCGKDKTFGKHPGNMLYRDLIEAKALDYAAAVYKLDKMKLTTEIVATMVTEFGTRFLRPVGIPTNKVGSTNVSTSENGTTAVPITSDGNATTDMIGWEEISLTAARDKTSHALRFCAANTVPNSNRAAAQQALNSQGNINNPQGSADDTQPVESAAASATNTVPTSLIQSQLQLAMGAVDTVSQEELLLQQNNALQKSIEELVQQKIKQKEQEQKQLEQAEQERQQQRLHQQSQLPASFNETTVAATNAVAVASAGSVASSGLRKFKKLPTKASLGITKSKTKIMPTAELLNSTTTPVKFNRVKVQKSSRKPKVVMPVMTNALLPPMPQHQQQQMEQGLNGQHNFRTGPSHVSPSSSPYRGQAHYQSQDNHPQSSIPGHHPPSTPSSNARTVSTDMIVLAHAAAVVEAAEAEERAAAAQHDEVVRRNTATIASYQQHQRPINSEDKK